jgi:hypothetical protein
LTKAEQKKLDTQARMDFLTNAYAAVLSCIAANSADIRSKIEFRVTQVNFNRYVRFHVYGKDMAILIYRDGKVALELKEFAHADYAEQLFDYAEETENQTAFLEELKEMLSWLIRVFFNRDVLDFHAYMDYISCHQDAETAYRMMHDDYGK